MVAHLNYTDTELDCNSKVISLLVQMALNKGNTQSDVAKYGWIW